MRPGKENYSTFLKSGFWRELSKRVKDAAGKCARCPIRSDLQAHHWRYPKDWYQTTGDDLIVLCRGCHEKEHGILRGRDWIDKYQEGDVDLDIAFERFHSLNNEIMGWRFGGLGRSDKSFLGARMVLKHYAWWLENKERIKQLEDEHVRENIRIAV